MLRVSPKSLIFAGGTSFPRPAEAQNNNSLTITVDEAKKRVSLFLDDFSAITRSGNSKETGSVIKF